MIEHRRIAKLRFDRGAADYFDSAALGLCPRDVDDDGAFAWDHAVDVVQQKFGKLLGQHKKTISVFHNTTAGVQRILLRLGHLLGPTEPTLLLTDLEYPGIVSAVDEAWMGRLIMAQVADLILKGQASKVTEKLKSSILMARPSVVYLSHIARVTGYRICDSIVDFIRSNLPATVIVLDGAQACGNIRIDDELVSKIDFYVTSGHKWLCGRQTLGLVYAQERWGLRDPAQSYSMTRGSTGTGSRDVILSLQTSLSDFNGERSGHTGTERMNAIEQHNSSLAMEFSREIKKKRLGIPIGLLNTGRGSGNNSPETWRWNGIATIVFDSNEMVAKLKTSKFKVTPLGDEAWRDNLGASSPGKRYFLDPDKRDVFRTANFREEYVPRIEGYAVRFCFHYYHSTKNVMDLIAKIDEIKKSLGKPSFHKPGSISSVRKK